MFINQLVNLSFYYIILKEQVFSNYIAENSRMFATVIVVFCQKISILSFHKKKILITFYFLSPHCEQMKPNCYFGACYVFFVSRLNMELNDLIIKSHSKTGF